MKKAVIGFRAHPNPVYHMFTNYICRDPISKETHVLMFQVDMNFGRGGGGDTIQPSIEGIRQDGLNSLQLWFSMFPWSSYQ